MKKLLFLINFCLCEVLWIPEIPDEQDSVPGGENMVVCPPGSEFVKEIKGDPGDICNYGLTPIFAEADLVPTENKTSRTTSSRCVCHQPRDSSKAGYVLTRYKGCIPKEDCCADNNAELTLVEENGQKKYTCVCKRGFEEVTYRSLWEGMVTTCAEKCPENEVYSGCLANEADCHMIAKPRICIAGCACKEGFKRIGKKCVKPKECPVCPKGAIYNSPPNKYFERSSLGPAYSPVKDKYGGACQCLFHHTRGPDGTCLDEQAVCEKYGGLYDASNKNARVPGFHFSKWCNDIIPKTLMRTANRPCHCPEFHLLTEYYDKEAGLRGIKCVHFSQCKKISEQIQEEKEARDENVCENIFQNPEYLPVLQNGGGYWQVWLTDQWVNISMDQPYDRRWTNKDNQIFDNTLIRKVCDCSFNTSFGFLYNEKKFKWAKVSKLAQMGLSMKSESETAIYLRCQHGGTKKGPVPMQVCKDARKITRVNKKETLQISSPNPSDAEFCTKEEKLLDLAKIMKPLKSPKIGVLKKATNEHAKIKKLLIGPKKKKYSVNDCMGEMKHTDSNETNPVYLLDNTDPMSWNDKILKKKSLLAKCKVPKKSLRPEWCYDKNYPIDGHLAKCSLTVDDKTHLITKGAVKKTLRFLNRMHNHFAKNPFYCF